MEQPCGFEDIRLVDEWIAERPYRPVACKHTYRLVILRKNLQVSEPRQQRLFDDYRYFLYITDDWDSTPEEIVFDANDRCQQENALPQLNAVRALHAPLDSQSAQQQRLYADQPPLAWNLKAWFALCLPEPCGPKKAKQAEQKRGLLMMEFRTFVNFLKVRARPSRTNWPSIGGPSIGLERVAVCVPAIGRAAATAAPLLMPACRVSRGRHSCRLFKTGIRKSPSAAGAEPRNETSNSSKPSRDPKIGHRHGRTVTFCAPRCRPSDGKCEPAYACLRPRPQQFATIESLDNSGREYYDPAPR